MQQQVFGDLRSVDKDVSDAAGRRAEEALPAGLLRAQGGDDALGDRVGDVRGHEFAHHGGAIALERAGDVFCRVRCAKRGEGGAHPGLAAKLARSQAWNNSTTRSSPSMQCPRSGVNATVRPYFSDMPSSVLISSRALGLSGWRSA